MADKFVSIDGLTCRERNAKRPAYQRALFDAAADGFYIPELELMFHRESFSNHGGIVSREDASLCIFDFGY